MVANSSIMFKTGPRVINLKGPGGTGEMNDLEFQQREALRQQQLAMANALRARALDFGGTEMIGQHAVEKSPWEILGKLGAGAIGAQDSKFLQQQALDDQKQRQEGLSKALGEYVAQRDGAPGGDPLAGPTPDGTPLTTLPTPADPRKAAIGAMTSGYRELQGLGQMDLTEQAKAAAAALKARMDPAEAVKVMFPHATPKSQQAMMAALANGQDPRAVFEGKRDLKQFDPEKEILDANMLGQNGAAPQNPFMGAPKLPNAGALPPASAAVPGEIPADPAARTAGGMASPVIDYKPPRLTEEVIGGDRYQRNPVNGKLTKLDNAPKVSLSNIGNTINKGENKFVEKHNELAATRLDDQYKVALNAINTNNKLSSIAAKLEQDAPMITGFGSGPIAKAKSLAKLAGVKVDDAQLENSETFDRTVKSILGGYLATMGARLTDKDLDVLREAIVTRDMQPGSIKSALADIQAENTQAIKLYEESEKTFRQQYPTMTISKLPMVNQVPFSPPQPPAGVPVAPPPPPAPGQPRRIDFGSLLGGRKQ
jgi:hypothetical protein